VTTQPSPSASTLLNISTPVKSETLVTTQPLVDPPAGAPSTAASAVWSPLTLIGFRIAVIYFLCFVFISRDGTIFGLFPHVGRWIGIVLL
jgi:hypothetical protein